MGGEWYAPEVWHDYCARRFLGVVPGPYGTGIPISTRKLKVGEFMDYMGEVEAWAYTDINRFDFEWREAA